MEVKRTEKSQVEDKSLKVGWSTENVHCQSMYILDVNQISTELR